MTKCSIEQWAKPARAILIVSCVGTLLLVTTMRRDRLSLAQEGSWTELTRLSHSSSRASLSPDDAWFPDMAVDSQGRVHVVWCYTTRMMEDEQPVTLAEEFFVRDMWLERLAYTAWDGDSWAAPNDIVPPIRVIARNAIAVDSNDVLHLAYQDRIPGLGAVGIYHKSARADTAWSAPSWSPRRLVSARGGSYATDLAVDSHGVLHLVFDDTGDLESRQCPGCKDVYYRRSTDRGRTWSAPLNLGPTPLGASREQIEIDKADTIHVTWDEASRPTGGQEKPLYGAYTFSTDGGLTWQQPINVSYPVPGVAQLTVGADGQGGVMLVWRVTAREYNRIYYQWSPDLGERWTKPTEIPRIFARPWTTPFDMYDMATDSAGRIHLVVVGRHSDERDAPLGIYHLAWDGDSWSKPEEVFQKRGFQQYVARHLPPGAEWEPSAPKDIYQEIYRLEALPEYPKIVVSHGNRLHVAWFTRPDVWRGGGYDVWYRRGEAEAPHQTPVPASEPAATPVAEPSASEPETISTTPTLFPTLIPSEKHLPDGLYTEGDELIRLGIGLSPIVLAIGLVLLVRGRRNSR